MKRILLRIIVLCILVSSLAWIANKPTLYIIGDSTVRNTTTPGGQWGWGSIIGDFLDTSKIVVSNQAMAGRSTRTFIKEGRWDKVLSTLKAGDYVMMQFGHNEGSKPDTSRNGYRGVLRGIGEDSVMLTWADGTIETVHSYGWYIRKFVRDVKARGAYPIVLSLIPRNDWKDGKVLRSVNSFGQYAAEVAKQEGAWFVDLNSITADKYDAMGTDKVKQFFPQEHTHTNYDGAKINAASVIEGVQLLPDCGLNKYITK
ncbi:MAG: rhamnogalacturonan acetylesterase [Bacteroidota bacterium]